MKYLIVVLLSAVLSTFIFLKIDNTSVGTSIEDEIITDMECELWDRIKAYQDTLEYERMCFEVLSGEYIQSQGEIVGLRDTLKICFELMNNQERQNLELIKICKVLQKRINQ